MTQSSLIRIALAILTVAMWLVPAALAGGESKSQAPFTRPTASGGSHGGVAQVVSTGQTAEIRGEPKNEAPFTDPSTDDPGLAIALRQIAKGDLSMYRADEKKRARARRRSSAPAMTAAVRAHRFGWADATVGAVATLGVVLAGVGGVFVTRGVRSSTSLRDVDGQLSPGPRG